MQLKNKTLCLSQLQTMGFNKRRTLDVKKRSRRLIDRLTYCPKKHKQKVVKSMRKRLQERKKAVTNVEPAPVSTLKFGSININGLDMEASWAVSQIISNRGYDVK